MIHCWTILCNHSIIDKDTNSLTIIDTLEEIQYQRKAAAGIPFTPISMEVVTLWARDNPNAGEKCETRIRFVSPKNETLGDPTNIAIDLSIYKRNRSRLKIFGLPPLIESGQYQFVVELLNSSGNKWEIVARVPLDVSITNIEEAPK